MTKKVYLSNLLRSSLFLSAFCFYLFLICKALTNNFLCFSRSKIVVKYLVTGHANVSCCHGFGRILSIDTSGMKLSTYQREKMQSYDYYSSSVVSLCTSCLVFTV